jgi:hypothetical protein
MSGAASLIRPCETSRRDKLLRLLIVERQSAGALRQTSVNPSPI